MKDAPSCCGRPPDGKGEKPGGQDARQTEPEAYHKHAATKSDAAAQEGKDVMEGRDLGNACGKGAKQAVREETAPMKGQVVCGACRPKAGAARPVPGPKMKRICKNEGTAHAEAVGTTQKTEDKWTDKVEHRASVRGRPASPDPDNPFNYVSGEKDCQSTVHPLRTGTGRLNFFLCLLWVIFPTHTDIGRLI